jgi:hypothetical protein
MVELTVELNARRKCDREVAPKVRARGQTARDLAVRQSWSCADGSQLSRVVVSGGSHDVAISYTKAELTPILPIVASGTSRSSWLLPVAVQCLQLFQYLCEHKPMPFAYCS